MQEYDLPDTEERERLKNLRDSLRKARSALPEIGEAGDVADHVDAAADEMAEAVYAVEDGLSDLPEWDARLVEKLVTENVDRSGTDIRRVDTSIVVEFEVGQMGDKTAFRYETKVTGGNVWFHQEIDGEWETVWTN